VNQIRQLRSEMETLRHWAGDSAQAKPVLAAAKQFDEKMTPIEEELIQVKLKSSEGNLRYPSQLNEALDSLAHTEDSADSAPPAQMQQVFDLLNGRLEAQLVKWQEILSKDLPALNQLMHAQGVPDLQTPTGVPKE